MKKKLWILVFTAAQIFVIYDASCTAQTRAKGNDKNRGIIVSFIEKNKTLFSTVEEITYNDSIKDQPRDYTIVKEREAIEKGTFRYLNFGQDRIRLAGVSQEQAYLSVYEEFCKLVLNYTFSIGLNPEDINYGFFKINMKLFNNEGLDILHLVDFPDKKKKEAKILTNQIKKVVHPYLWTYYRGFEIDGLNLPVIEIFLEEDSICKHQYDSLSLRLPWQTPADKKSSGKNSYLKSLPAPRI